MFSMLPDLTPRDVSPHSLCITPSAHLQPPANPTTHQQSHSLWYTSSRNPALSHSFLNPSSDTLDNDNNNLNGPRTTTNPTPTNPGNHPTQNTPAPNPATTSRQNQGGGGGPNNPNTNQSPSTAAQIIDRSLLGRLHAEELLLERRRAAVTNLGSTWLKPPGLAKTLFQMREERREAEEHAEAMRREMLAQELAEAEAEAAAAAAGGGGGGLPQPALQGVEGEEDGEEEEDGGRDLDEEIPEGDLSDAGMGFGFDGGSSEDEEEEEDEEDEEEEEEDDDDEEEAERRRLEEEEGLSEEERLYRRELREEEAREAALEARRQEVLARSEAQQRRLERRSTVRFDDGLSDLSEEERSQLLNEEDLISQPMPAERHSQVEPLAPDMDMDADLDDDVPEAEDGGYEHTDSEASLDDLEDDSSVDPHDLSYARSSRILHHRSSLRQSEGPRSSLDISGLLDGSSIMGTSPHVRRMY
jgi:hypothetical protein